MCGCVCGNQDPRNQIDFENRIKVLNLHSFGHNNQQYIVYDNQTKQEYYLRVINKNNRIPLIINLFHPNLAYIFKYTSNDLYYFLQIEKYDALPIFDYFDQLDYFTEYDVAKIMKQLFEVLQFCSSQNILHYSISYHKILITKEHNLILLGIYDDYIRKSYDYHSLFLPQEYENYSEKSILYYIGIIISLLLSGRVPQDINKNYYDYSSEYSKIFLQKILNNQIGISACQENQWIIQYSLEPDLGKVINYQIIKQDKDFLSEIEIDYWFKEFFQNFINARKLEFNISKMVDEGNDINKIKLTLNNPPLYAKLRLMAKQQQIDENIKLLLKEAIQNITVKIREQFKNGQVKKNQIIHTIDKYPILLTHVDDDINYLSIKEIYHLDDELPFLDLMRKINIKLQEYLNIQENLLRMM